MQFRTEGNFYYNFFCPSIIQWSGEYNVWCYVGIEKVDIDRFFDNQWIKIELHKQAIKKDFYITSDLNGPYYFKKYGK